MPFITEKYKLIGGKEINKTIIVSCTWGEGPDDVMVEFKKKYFIVPINEHCGIKELRVSTAEYTFWKFGPISGAKNADNVPLEELEFNSYEEAMKAIIKWAIYLAP